MSIVDKIKTKFSKKSAITVDSNYVDVYTPDEIIPFDADSSNNVSDIVDITVSDVVDITDAVGNFLVKTNSVLQQNLAEIDANLQINLARMESEMEIEMQKEEHIHSRKMADRVLVSKVIEKSGTSMNPELASRILDAIENLSNNDR